MNEIMYLSDTMETTKQYKIVLVGDGEVGKSTYVNRLITGDFKKVSVPTIGCEIHPFSYSNSVVNLWDCAGKNEYSSLGEGYWSDADGAIVMFDVMNHESYDNLPKWMNRLRTHVPDTQIVICGNKVDCKGRKVFKIPRRYKVPYFDLSVKSNYNFEKPIKYFIDLSTGKI